ncbi:hypothetical protein DPMN_058414 [Dreissena polymorpha]|uniref:Uncharacterized protein n=1 Tax=Dreissena polymorpha TaxID=45954 RepID=A0A9D4C225_DREPO|nr:hypothetical protein DPMN_058414 [Dreissena polymorpha]
MTREDVKPLDAAADAMDSPALLYVALAKLKTVVTIQTIQKMYDGNPLDAAADAMDSPALLYVALAKLKTVVTIQTIHKMYVLKTRRTTRIV